MISIKQEKHSYEQITIKVRVTSTALTGQAKCYLMLTSFSHMNFYAQIIKSSRALGACIKYPVLMEKSILHK